MAERFKAPVLKTGMGASPSWVRIPLSPPILPLAGCTNSGANKEASRRSQAGDDRHDPKGDDDPRGGQNRSPSPSPHGRTQMIVFPLRRSFGFKAATASSRVETLPMFVRSRPSRTRWTISLSWARSDSTTKSTARPWRAAPRSARRWTPVFLRLESGLRTASGRRRR